MEGYHRSVLLGEVVEALNVRDAWYIDCTIGDGGHSIEIIRRGGKVVGIDVDPQALKRVRQRFDEAGVDKRKYILVQGNFRDLKKLIQTGTKFAGVLFDLGVSSLQLETPERGFSFGSEGPLDMRMDPALGVRALDLINAGGRKELYELFSRLGEEKYSRALADAVVRARQVRPLTTTTELAGLVARVAGIRGKIHPATRVFQALRIAVNDELAALEEALPQALEVLDKNGRIVVVSFHSLEDRIVKHFFKSKELIIPSKEEIKDHPRSRSAKMRVFEKT